MGNASTSNYGYPYVGGRYACYRNGYRHGSGSRFFQGGSRGGIAFKYNGLLWGAITSACTRGSTTYRVYRGSYLLVARIILDVFPRVAPTQGAINGVQFGLRSGNCTRGYNNGDGGGHLRVTQTRGHYRRGYCGRSGHDARIARGDRGSSTCYQRSGMLGRILLYRRRVGQAYTSGSGGGLYGL